jgi:hypothetical protein
VSAPGDTSEVEAEAMAGILQAGASAYSPGGSGSAGGYPHSSTAAATRATYGAAISIARATDFSDPYQAGYNDGKAGNLPAPPSPLSSDATDAYNQGYQDGQAQAGGAQAVPAPAAADSTATPNPVPAPVSATAANAPGAGGLGQVLSFPVMDDILQSPTVEAARQSDWEAGLKDFQERGGWIRWQGSPRDPVSGARDDVHGTYVIQEWPLAVGAANDDDPNVDPRDKIDQGNPPANDSLTFTVGHYHQHPPLDPSQHRDPANFPVGASNDHDVPLADKLGCPGVVRDFTDTSRQVVRDYRYGPDLQRH